MGSSSRVWLLLPFLFSAIALWAGKSTLMGLRTGSSSFNRRAKSELLPHSVWASSASISDDKSNNKDWVEMQIRDVVPLPEVKTHAVVLISSEGKVMLPVFVSEEVALSVALRLAQKAPSEPLATDLLASVLKQLGGRLISVEIDALDGDEYQGQITVDRSGERFSIKARPSDALALALDSGAHVYARPAVLKDAGITPEQIEELRKKLPKDQTDPQLRPPTPPNPTGTPKTNISL